MAHPAALVAARLPCAARVVRGLAKLGYRLKQRQPLSARRCAARQRRKGAPWGADSHGGLIVGDEWLECG